MTSVNLVDELMKDYGLNRQTVLHIINKFKSFNGIAIQIAMARAECASVAELKRHGKIVSYKKRKKRETYLCDTLNDSD